MEAIIIIHFTYQFLRCIVLKGFRTKYLDNSSMLFREKSKRFQFVRKTVTHSKGGFIMLSMIGMIGGLILLIVLTMRGVNLLIAGPLSALFVAVLSGLPLFPQLVGEGEAN